MSIGEFAIKAAVITACIGILLFKFYPRYEYIPGTSGIQGKRFDTVSGEFVNWSHCWR